MLCPVFSTWVAIVCRLSKSESNGLRGLYSTGLQSEDLSLSKKVCTVLYASLCYKRRCIFLLCIFKKCCYQAISQKERATVLRSARWHSTARRNMLESPWSLFKLWLFGSMPSVRCKSRSHLGHGCYLQAQFLASGPFGWQSDPSPAPASCLYCAVKRWGTFSTAKNRRMTG